MTNTKLEPTSTNVEKTDKQNSGENTEQPKYVHIKNSPFTAVPQDGKYFISMGELRMTNNVFDTPEKAEKYTKTMNWEFLFTVIAGVIEGYKKMEKTMEKLENING